MVDLDQKKIINLKNAAGALLGGMMDRVLKSILAGNHKKVDFPGAMGAMHHGGFDISGFTGSGYKSQAVG